MDLVAGDEGLERLPQVSFQGQAVDAGRLALEISYDFRVFLIQFKARRWIL